MSDTRSFEMTIELAVSPEDVWRALTDPAEIVRWFATRSEITPGEGGKWMVSWDGNWSWTTDIEIWEPNRRLRLMDRNSRPYDARGEAINESVAPMPIAIDWYLEGKGGTTMLRLVHSGFGRGGAWDDEYDGVSVGWLLELNGLRHYLERHRGGTREVAWTRSVVAVPTEELWRRLIGPDGIVGDASFLALRPGDPCAVTLSTGDRLDGTVMALVPGRGFQVTVNGLNDGIYRLWVDRVGDESSVNSWLTTYGLPASVAKAFDARMRAEIDRVTGAPATA